MSEDARENGEKKRVSKSTTQLTLEPVEIRIGLFVYDRMKSKGVKSAMTMARKRVAVCLRFFFSAAAPFLTLFFVLF